MLINLVTIQPPSNKLHPAADENKYRYTQPGNLQRVGDLETYNPKRDVSIKSYLRPQGILQKRRHKKINMVVLPHI